MNAYCNAISSTADIYDLSPIAITMGGPHCGDNTKPPAGGIVHVFVSLCDFYQHQPITARIMQAVETQRLVMRTNLYLSCAIEI